MSTAGERRAAVIAQQRFIRKREGDPFVYIYTPALAQRDDMVECTKDGVAIITEKRLAFQGQFVPGSENHDDVKAEGVVIEGMRRLTTSGVAVKGPEDLPRQLRECGFHEGLQGDVLERAVERLVASDRLVVTRVRVTERA